MNARFMFFLRPGAIITDAGATALRRSRGRRRAAFTLVEVIVVLVILAILAAIAIPALTGYIDKAQEKQYIAEARNAVVAVRAVLDEAYASGELGSVDDAFKSFSQGVVHGSTSFFDISQISSHFPYDADTNRYIRFYNRASELLGTDFPHQGTPSKPQPPGHWAMSTCAPVDSGANAASADGFDWVMYPQGINYQPLVAGSVLIVVTYKVSISPAPTSATDLLAAINPASGRISYDAGAGYKVYQF
jgi:prepilin-type N-terminal cleavage/methylation domain-containing protein